MKKYYLSICISICMIFIVTFLYLMLSKEDNDKIENEKIELQIGFETSIHILNLIKNKDYESLSEYIHPEKGVIFIPYTFIDYEENLVLKSVQIRDIDTDNSKYIWGFYGPSPRPIELTASEYFEQFVYDKDYLNASQIAFNYSISQGNSMENTKDIFEDCIFVDFYDEGTQEYGNLDWTSLKIVMEKYDGEFKVVAIVHSSYTL